MRSIRNNDGGQQYEHTIRQMQEWLRLSHGRIESLHDQLTKLQARVEAIEKAPTVDAAQVAAIETSLRTTAKPRSRGAKR